MTDKELAEALEKLRTLLIATGEVHRSKQLDTIKEAARRLRELPDPAKSDEDRMRELVEKHKCFKGVLGWRESTDMIDFHWVWKFTQTKGDGCYLPTSAALTVIRGIVKAKCDAIGNQANWKPMGDGNLSGQWQHHWRGISQYHDDELAAIDALLTAMNT